MAHTKIGRNDPCPCGSGKKYKRCCLALVAGFYTQGERLSARAKVDAFTGLDEWKQNVEAAIRT
jgi:hypothetical protein